MTILKKIVVVTGEYEKNGETKKRYKTIGHVHEGQYGKYITLDASANLAAFPRREGDDRVTCNLYDPEPRQEGGGQRPAQGGEQKPAPQGGGQDFDNDIPFSPIGKGVACHVV